MRSQTARLPGIEEIGCKGRCLVDPRRFVEELGEDYQGVYAVLTDRVGANLGRYNTVVGGGGLEAGADKLGADRLRPTD